MISNILGQYNFDIKKVIKKAFLKFLKQIVCIVQINLKFQEFKTLRILRHCEAKPASNNI